MAHFAKLDDNNKVLAVHVVNNDVITIDGKESEQAGIDFLTNLHGHAKWKQTSYNGTFRKNYAGVDDIYDQVRDAFVKEQPFPSWIFNEDTCKWNAPIEYPSDGKSYLWNEENHSWENKEVNIH
jgi:hypothetical protein